VIAPYATDVSANGSELDALNEKMNALSQASDVDACNHVLVWRSRRRKWWWWWWWW
jgi:hypothetical protein